MKTDGDPNGRRIARLEPGFLRWWYAPFDLSSTTGLHKNASLRYQGATGAPPDDRRTRGRKDRRPSVNPCDARPRGAPPSPSYTEKPDGGGKVPGSRERGRGRGRDDSECLLATPTTPALVRDARRRRRASELRMGCARRVCSVVVLASRPRAASNGHRSGGYRMFLAQ